MSCKILCLATIVSWTSAELSLKQLHLVFRHGQRAPADTYPTDPHIGNKFLPYGWGQLTNVGRMQQYKQGQWLKERYSHFLGSYHTDEVEAWTTDVDRTKISMQLMMAGLYPPTGNQVWNPKLMWQPIPSTHQLLDNDKLLLVRSCSRYSEAVKEVMSSPEIVHRLSKYQDLYSYLTEKTGKGVKTPDDVQDVYSTLKAEESFNLTLPEWTTTVYPERMGEVTALSFDLNAWTPELQRIKGGPLLKKILENSQSVSNGKPAKKLYAYAGHDSTISNVLRALKVWETQIPVYNIMAIFEVIKGHDNDFYMKILLRNTTEHEPFILTVPGCEKLCPLTKLKQLTSDVLPKDVNINCKVKSEGYIPPEDHGP